MRKRKLLLFFMVLLLLVVPSSAMASKSIPIFLNNEALPMYGVVKSGRTLVPIRAIGESLGMDVEWDADSRTASVYNEDLKMEFPIGKKEIYINGVPEKIDIAPQLINGRTMLPIRFIAENMELHVDWIASTQTVDIRDYKHLSGAIYTTKTGSRYHRQKCGNGKYYLSTLEKAKKRGLTPCNVCY